jgi:hypothetical protein
MVNMDLMTMKRNNFLKKAKNNLTRVSKKFEYYYSILSIPLLIGIK